MNDSECVTEPKRMRKGLVNEFDDDMSETEPPHTIIDDDDSTPKRKIRLAIYGQNQEIRKTKVIVVLV